MNVCLGIGWTADGHKGTFWSDRNIWKLDCVDMYLLKTIKAYTENVWILCYLYVLPKQAQNFMIRKLYLNQYFYKKKT